MHRRQFIATAFAAPFLSTHGATAGEAIHIADMHFHLFFFGRRPAATQPLAKNMSSGGATLVSWSLVGDVPWLQATAGGFKQKGAPQPGQAMDWFTREIGRVKAHLVDQNLPLALTVEHVAAAAAGQPHVVLSIEGASFVDDDIGHLTRAHEMGVRHIQLVHFIRNRIGDFQTAPAEHLGLTEFGARVILECNRLGILVDLAHCTEAVVRAALELTKVPFVWSHSSVQREYMLQPLLPAAWRARQLTFGAAKAIATHGGVVGLWSLRSDIGDTIETYAKRINELADWLGDDHVAFGTDMNALARPILSSFADLRRVVGILENRRVDRNRIRKIAIGNYVRALTTAMRAGAA